MLARSSAIMTAILSINSDIIGENSSLDNTEEAITRD